MSGGGGVSGAVSSEGLSGEGGSGSAEWRRMYDRIEALLPRVEALAADRARLEALNRTQRDLSGAREKDLHARLVQVEASRTRWKKAYIDLHLLVDPKIIELKEKDSEDSRKREALFDDDNSVPEIQLRGGRRHVELSETNVGDEDIVRDLRAELTKLKQASETLSTNKDKEAIEIAQKLQQNIEELQVAARKKDDAIARLRVEAVDAKNKLRAMEKDYTALVKIKEVEGAEATEATHKFQNNLEELQVAAGDKDDEIRRLAVVLAAKNNLLVPEDEIQKLKDGQLESLKRKRASLSNPRIVSPACSSTEQKRSSMMSCPGGVELLLSAATASGDLNPEALSGDLNPEASGSVGGSAGKRTSDRHVWRREESEDLWTYVDTPAKRADFIQNTDLYCHMIANELNAKYRPHKSYCDLTYLKVHTKAKELLKSKGLWQKTSGSVAQSEASGKAAAGNRKGSKGKGKPKSSSRSVHHTGAVASATKVSKVLMSVSSAEGVTSDVLEKYSEVLTYAPHYVPIAMLKGSSEETKMYLDSILS